MKNAWEYQLEDLSMVKVPPEGTPLKGLWVMLHGRGETERTQTAPWEQELVDAGWVFMYPFYGPWGWGTEEVVERLDDLIDKAHEGLPALAELPYVLSGGSMGGEVALYYLVHTRHRLERVYIVCPVTDCKGCYDMLPVVRRSMINGFWGKRDTLVGALVDYSPLGMVDQLPDIPYLVVHHDADELVPREMHGDPLVEKMRAAGRTVEYWRVNGPQCGPLDDEKRVLRHRFIDGTYTATSRTLEAEPVAG